MGGIGNQMFIYATARRLAHVNGAELVLDDRSGFQRDEYKRSYQLDKLPVYGRLAGAKERLEPFSRLRRILMYRRARQLPFEATPYLREEAQAFDPRLLTRKVLGTVYLDGYWQSHHYFDDIAPYIRSELTPPAPSDERNQACARAMAQAAATGGAGAVAVHVRFFDAPGVSGGNNTSAAYYEAAVEYMLAERPGAKFFLFSDHPPEARALLKIPDDHLWVVDHNRGANGALADLWLMAQCQHFIIANSTFSWWGAWLSSVAIEKRVIAPGFTKCHGVSGWGFDGLLPRDWVRI